MFQSKKQEKKIQFAPINKPQKKEYKGISAFPPYASEEEIAQVQATGKPLQAMPAMSKPDDPAELEADHIADQVMHSSSTMVSKDRNSPMIHPKQSPAGTVFPDTTGATQAVQSGGTPLPDTSKGFFEDRFGADFSDVKIHTDTKAANAASAINARAYTVGNDIAFAEGEYQPGTNEGKKLMAHELTHVVQQGGGVNRREIQRRPVDLSQYENYNEIVTDIANTYGLTIIGVGETDSPRAHGAFDILIKTNKDNWLTFLTAIKSGFGMISSHTLFSMFVRPFLLAAVDPSYILNFVNVNVPYGTPSDVGRENFLQPSQRISTNDALEFLRAIFQSDTTMTFENLNSLEQEALGAFLGKYLSLYSLESAQEISMGTSEGLSLGTTENLAALKGNSVKIALVESAMSFVAQGSAVLIEALSNADDVNTLSDLIGGLEISFKKAGYLMQNALLAYRVEKAEAVSAAESAFDTLVGFATSKISLPIPGPLSSIQDMVINEVIINPIKEHFINFVENMYTQEELEIHRVDAELKFESFLKKSLGVTGTSTVVFTIAKEARRIIASDLASKFAEGLQHKK